MREDADGGVRRGDVTECICFVNRVGIYMGSAEFVEDRPRAGGGGRDVTAGDWLPRLPK